MGLGRAKGLHKAIAKTKPPREIRFFWIDKKPPREGAYYIKITNNELLHLSALPGCVSNKNDFSFHLLLNFQNITVKAKAMAMMAAIPKYPHPVGTSTVTLKSLDAGSA